MTVTLFARSACFGVTPGATYAFSFFYRFSSPAIAWVPGVIKLFTSTDCSGFPINPDQFALGTLRDGSWHQTGATVTAPITALSAYISMEGPCQTFPCASSPDPTIAFNVDDVVLEAAPVAVTFRGADARRTPVGVVVRWRTAAETGLLGFNVYRGAIGERMRATKRLIPANGRRSYTYVDRRLPPIAARYWIQTANIDGSRSWYGPVTVSRAGG